ncbi:MAG: hypothetical protein Q7W05_14460 [Deltaproteobacteria bacterium]|nr:hypothetical protein [Deltaproteobacteria bacterium]
MKKNLAAVLIVTLAATSSFAASLAATGVGTPTEAGRAVIPNIPTDDTTAGGNNTAVGKTSTGVYISWSMATGASKYASYAIKTQHQSGVKMYGTASNTTIITWSTATKNADCATPTSSDYQGIVGGTWTVM